MIKDTDMMQTSTVKHSTSAFTYSSVKLALKRKLTGICIAIVASSMLATIVAAQPVNAAGSMARSANIGTQSTTAVVSVAPVSMYIPNNSSYVSVAQQAAIAAGISSYLYVRQIQQESGFNPNAYSPAGAIGIAQIMPGTAAELGVNPHDPVASLYAAAHLMARHANMFGGDYAKALGAYNAGPGAVQYAVSRGGDNWRAFLPAETQNYIAVIMG